MIINEELYFSIIHVLVESACITGELDDGSEDEFGEYIKMDDIKAVSQTGWGKPTEADLSFILKSFNDKFEHEKKLTVEDLDGLEVRQTFYKVEDDYFADKLELGVQSYLGKRDYRIKNFEYYDDVFDQALLEPDFDLFYKDGEEFKRIEFH